MRILWTMNNTCKLQLLSLAALLSFLSVGVSFLLLMASGTGRGTPVVVGEVYQQVLSPPHRLEDRGRQILAGLPHYQSKRVGYNTDLMQKTTDTHQNNIKRNELALDEGSRGEEQVNAEIHRGVYDKLSTSQPIPVTQKHKRLSKKHLLALRASKHNSSSPPLLDAHIMNTTHHSSRHMKATNSSTHRMLPDSSKDIASLKLVPGHQRNGTSPRDLCPHPTSPCMEFLPLEEQAVFTTCEARSVKWKNESYCQCHFMNTTGQRRVALVSLPGSGNTWLRGLLERATGVCTGSLFCDKTLRAGGMCGEGVREGVLTVKTHDTRLQWTNVPYRNGTWSDARPFFDAAVVLVRSPFRALIAEWNRQKAYRFSNTQTGSSHVKYLDSSKYFLENRGWDEFVREQIRKWKMIVAENIFRNRDHPVMVVFYEQLKSSQLLQEVKRVLKFLQFPYSEEEVSSAVQSGFSSYYRNHTDSFQHFTGQQRMVVNTAVSEITTRLRAHNFIDLANHLDAYRV